MTDEAFLRVLDQAGRAIDQTGVPHALIGGIASVVLGRPRWTGAGRTSTLRVRFEDSRTVLGVCTLGRRISPCPPE